MIFGKHLIMSYTELGLRKPFVVVGLGKTGLSLIRLLKALGFKDQDIFTYDDKDPSAQYQSHEKLLAEVQPKTLFVSPGVPLATPWISDFAARGGRISSEFELSFSLLQTERVVGVTGSLGKSTTTSLLFEGAKAIDQHAFAGGNLGIPLSDYAYEVLSGRPRAQFVILEISSYQLENFRNLDLECGVITY